MTVTCTPWAWRPAAASRPKRPPPITTAYREDERVGAGGDQEFVVGCFAFLGDDHFSHAVDACDHFTEAAVDPVALAVVVPARLGPEEGDVVEFAIGLKKMFHSAA